MTNKTSNKLSILENTIRHTIEDAIIDFSFLYDVTGKVYSVKAMVYDLPISAQKLVLGENPESKKEKIESFKKLLTVILPLGIVNQPSFFNNKLKHIYHSIEKEIKNQNINRKKLYEFAESESLEYYILSSQLMPSKYPDKFNLVWKNVIELIQKIDGNINTNNLWYLGYYYPQFGFKIIPLIIPFIIYPNIKRIAFENLENYTHENCKVYLLSELGKCKDGQVLGGILKALSKQEIEGIQIQKEIIEIYESDLDLPEDAKANLMEVLKHFPNEETFRIGINIIKENNKYSSGRAASILVGIGYPAKKIADIILPKLHAAEPTESEAAFSILCNAECFSEYIPESEELIQIYVNTLEKNQNLNIAYSMPSLIRSKYDSNTAFHIIDHLASSNPNVLEGILILISVLLYEPGINSTPFTSEASIKRYIQLIKHEKTKVVEHAMRIIGKIGRNRGLNQYIFSLNERINFENNSLINLYAMRAINNILNNTEYISAINKNYLAALQLSNYNYREAALKGLRHSPDNALKKSITYFEDDPSKEVQLAAKSLMKPVKRNRAENGLQRLMYSDLRPFQLGKENSFVHFVRFLSYYYYLIFKFKGKIPEKDKLMMSVLKSQRKKLRPSTPSKEKEIKLNIEGKED